MSSVIEKGPMLPHAHGRPTRICIRDGLLSSYSDVYTPEAVSALEALAHFNRDQKELMANRIARRTRRFQNRERIQFLDADSYIPRTRIKVSDAREGRFHGSEIPSDLQRQWIQGTGPAAKPRADIDSSIRNVAHALLSGADGWMFDGEDALGQIQSMSLDNQRNLKLAFAQDQGDHSGLAASTDVDDKDLSRPRPASR